MDIKYNFLRIACVGTPLVFAGLIGALSFVMATCEPNEPVTENLELKTKDVRGDIPSEKFYDGNQGRSYLEVDGKPIDENLPK